MKSVTICYVPVLHKGYENFFKEANKEADDIFLVGEEILSAFPELDYVKRKDSIRALETGTLVKMIDSLKIFQKVKILDLRAVEMLAKKEISLFMPTEDISFLLFEKFFPKKKVKFFQIFLRWHRGNVEEKKQVSPYKVVSLNEFEKEMMSKVFKESEKSWDWWRQVGALVVKDEQLLLIAHNKHTPHEQMPYAFGDPRSIFKKGIHIELSTADHAEAALIAEAAKQKDISLKGAHLFVTDFPCPPCARLVAGSGIKRCYFSRGYAMLDGEDILKDAGVEIIFVKNP